MNSVMKFLADKVLYWPFMVVLIAVGLVFGVAILAIWLVAALLSPIIGKKLARQLAPITGPY